MKVYWSYTIGDTDDTFPNEFVSGPKNIFLGMTWNMIMQNVLHGNSITVILG